MKCVAESVMEMISAALLTSGGWCVWFISRNGRCLRGLPPCNHKLSPRRDKAVVHEDRQVHFFDLPSLAPLKPIILK
jgi:hypothetical protein